MRLLHWLNVGPGALHAVERALEVEPALARPGKLHNLEILRRAAIALFLGREIAVAMLLGVACTGDNVECDAAIGEMIERRDLARGQGWRDESRPMGDQEAEPAGMLGGMLGDQEAFRRRSRIAYQHKIEAGCLVRLREGRQIRRRYAALDDMDGRLAGWRGDPDHADHAHGHSSALSRPRAWPRRPARCRAHRPHPCRRPGRP